MWCRNAAIVAVLVASGGLFAQTPGWSQVTPAAQWTVRYSGPAVSFNGEMWVLGGTSNTGRKNDVWSTTDGVTWAQKVTSVNMWTPRLAHSATVFDSKIWVIGGDNASASPGPTTDEIWSSPDGANWTKNTAAAPFGRRHSQACVVFDSKFWVLGGWNGTANAPDIIWNSADGVNWTQVATAGTVWTPRRLHAAAVFNGKMWVIGGYTTAYINEVWSSSDGITWQQESAPAWSIRGYHKAEVYAGKLWVTAGYGGSDLGDVWSTPDGVNWTQETAPAWGLRYGHAMVAYDNRLWVMGGSYGSPSVYRNDVWAYFDGAPQISSTAPTTATAGNLYTYTIVATGMQPLTIGATGLPPWLALAGDTLSGTPNQGDIGLTGTITVTATNTIGMDSQNFQIDVQGVPPVITSAPVQTATVGVLYSYTVVATGIPAPTFSAGALPGWLSLNATTGELFGTPSAGDIASGIAIDITADNAWPPADTQNFLLDVEGVAPQITSTPPATATVGSLYTYNIVATGEPAPTLSVTGNPTWLTLVGNVLSGTPSGGDIGMTGTISITASGWPPDDVQAFQVNVVGVAPTFTSSPVVTATPTEPYLYTATVTGTPTPAMSAGALPSWLAFDPGTGELSGTPPTSAANSNALVTLTATNGVTPNAVQTFTIAVGKTPGSVGDSDNDGGSGCAVGGTGALALVALPALAAWRARRRRARKKN